MLSPIEARLPTRAVRRLPPLARVLIFQALFWAWFEPYQWALWKPLSAWRDAVRPHLGWAGLFLDLTWVKAAMTLLLLLFAARVLDRRPLRDYGYALTGRWLGQLALGFLLGLAWNELPVFVNWAAGGSHAAGFLHLSDRARAVGAPFAVALLPGLVSVLLTGFWEEATFRAHPMKNLAEALRVRGVDRQWEVQAVVLPTALYFGLTHLVNGGTLTSPGIGFAVGAGIVLGCLYWATGELALPVGFHAGTDFGSLSLVQSGAHPNTCVFLLSGVGLPWAGAFSVAWYLGTACLVLLWAQARPGRLLEHMQEGPCSAPC